MRVLQFLALVVLLSACTLPPSGQATQPGANIPPTVGQQVTDTFPDEASYPEPIQAATLPLGEPTATVLPDMSPAPQASGTIITGEGDFPPTQLIAPSMDGKHAQALFHIEGNTATQLLVFEELHINSTRASLFPSLDGKNVACLLTISDGTTAIEIVNLETPQRFRLAESEKPNPQEKGIVRGRLTSIIWMDHQNILYTREASAVQKSEIWKASIDGKSKTLLATLPISRILGLSKDQSQLYVTRLIEADWRLEGLAVYNLETQILENLWPSEETPQLFYYGMQLVQMPNGTARALFAYVEQGPGSTVFVKAPILYLGDPESREAQTIWSAEKHGIPDSSGFVYYDSPNGVVFSPVSEDKFLLSLNGELWAVEKGGKEQLLATFVSRLISWMPEGIVFLDEYHGTLQLVDETGRVLGKIVFEEWISR